MLLWHFTWVLARQQIRQQIYIHIWNVDQTVVCFVARFYSVWFGLGVKVTVFHLLSFRTISVDSNDPFRPQGHNKLGEAISIKIRHWWFGDDVAFPQLQKRRVHGVRPVFWVLTIRFQKIGTAVVISTKQDQWLAQGTENIMRKIFSQNYFRTYIWPFLFPNILIDSTVYSQLIESIVEYPATR